MSVTSHIEQLKKKHQHLSDSVETLQRSPSSTDAEIAALKKQKLMVKEEISKLSA
ncbi:MAG: YdcH family protein [Yoonia sp.]|nr:YdcH family protein [Yoonia sp.]